MNWRAWLREWGDAFRDAFNRPPIKIDPEPPDEPPLPKPPSEPPRTADGGYEPPKPTEEFIPAHSHTDEHPQWPKRKDRQ